MTQIHFTITFKRKLLICVKIINFPLFCAFWDYQLLLIVQFQLFTLILMILIIKWHLAIQYSPDNIISQVLGVVMPLIFCFVIWIMEALNLKGTILSLYWRKILKIKSININKVLVQLPIQVLVPNVQKLVLLKVCRLQHQNSIIILLL